MTPLATTEAAATWAAAWPEFCEHGVFLGDANPNRPCPDCAAGLIEAVR